MDKSIFTHYGGTQVSAGDGRTSYPVVEHWLRHTARLFRPQKTEGPPAVHWPPGEGRARFAGSQLPENDTLKSGTPPGREFGKHSFANPCCRPGWKPCAGAGKWRGLAWCVWLSAAKSVPSAAGRAGQCVAWPPELGNVRFVLRLGCHQYRSGGRGVHGERGGTPACCLYSRPEWQVPFCVAWGRKKQAATKVDGINTFDFFVGFRFVASERYRFQWQGFRISSLQAGKAEQLLDWRHGHGTSTAKWADASSA